MKEPLSLPRGSVRALLALFFSGVAGYLFVTGAPVPNELLVLTTTTVTYYFGTRSGEPPAEPDPVIEAPFIPESAG